MSLTLSLPFIRSAFAARESYGLDLGTHCAKLVRTNRDSRSWLVCDAATMDVNAPEANDDGVEYSTQLAAWLREFRRKRGIRGRCYLACSLPSTWYKSWTLNLPPGTREERRQMLAAELTNDEMTAGGWVIDFWESGFDAQDSTEVTAVAAPLKLVHELEHRINDVGFDFRFIDCPLTAAARCALLDKVQPANATALVLDWGDAEANILFARGGRCTYFRPLRRSGIRNLVQMISKAFEVPEDAARRLLHSYGFNSGTMASDDPVQDEIRELSRGPLERLSDELNRTLKYVQEQSPGDMPEEILLIGEGAALPGVDAAVSTAARRPARRWSPIGSFQPAADLAPLFAAAVSLSHLAGRV